MAIDLGPLHELPRSTNPTLDRIHSAALALAEEISTLHDELMAEPLTHAEEYGPATTVVAAARDQITLLMGSLAAQATAATVAENPPHPSDSAAAALAKRQIATRAAAHEIGTWMRQSHHRARRLIAAHALMNTSMPKLRDAVAAGRIDHESALAITGEAALAPTLQHQQRLDDVLAEDAAQLSAAGTRAWRNQARRRIADLDPQVLRDRTRRAHHNRRVTIHDADDGTSIIRAVLPRLTAHRAFTALEAAANALIRERNNEPCPDVGGIGGADGDPISRTSASQQVAGTTGMKRFQLTHHQAMADAFAQIITGDRPASPTSLTLNIVMTDRQLLEPDKGGPALIDGYNPVPLEELVSAIRRNPDTAWIRRLFTHPTSGQLIHMEQKKRRFTGAMAEFIRMRAGGICEAPYCNGTATHTDHIHPATRGGPTSISNGAALDASDNLTKSDHIHKARPTPRGDGLTWANTVGTITTHYPSYSPAAPIHRSPAGATSTPATGHERTRSTPLRRRFITACDYLPPPRTMRMIQ
ncbi:HNH endonuclease [Helcobacillus massiliensis]|uniref:HNH endonuclease n=1 Tax=Helcobacillus massiliensis TaxID=521392 RepID=UPI002553B97D|nr:DUF222 domain-containing protein [Helcobacillus massiliensis]MDK7742930.1 DUF222 domain-containing protein [Helcobacillus massiliensis]WOO92077.1 DUF222 domain-containing protein [Helcobacillus massiliensis]